MTSLYKNSREARNQSKRSVFLTSITQPLSDRSRLLIWALTFLEPVTAWLVRTECFCPLCSPPSFIWWCLNSQCAGIWRWAFEVGWGYGSEFPDGIGALVTGWQDQSVLSPVRSLSVSLSLLSPPTPHLMWGHNEKTSFLQARKRALSHQEPNCCHLDLELPGLQQWEINVCPLSHPVRDNLLR